MWSGRGCTTNKRIAPLRNKQRPEITYDMESIFFSESECVPVACKRGSSCWTKILRTFESDTAITWKRWKQFLEADALCRRRSLVSAGSYFPDATLSSWFFNDLTACWSTYWYSCRMVQSKTTKNTFLRISRMIGGPYGVDNDFVRYVSVKPDSLPATLVTAQAVCLPDVRVITWQQPLSRLSQMVYLAYS